MYDWLSDSISNSGTVVTANRRVARALRDEYSKQQTRAGKKAWRSPEIYAWPDWLSRLANDVIDQDELPIRVSAIQSQVLWERCLRKEVGDSEASISNLVRLCRDSWQRLADWQIPITELARSAQSDDQRVFASVAGRYLALLERENWVDDAGIGSFLLNQLENGRIRLSDRYSFIGFTRSRPLMLSIQAALENAGAQTWLPAVEGLKSELSLHRFENSAAELRAAGAWARAYVDKNPGAEVGIITNGLENDAEGIARQIREGATPGWQHGHRSLFDAVNVSYGSRFANYPAIANALLLLRWLVRDLSSVEVGLLLRSPLLSTEATGGRNQAELRLRQLPDRKWSPSMISAEFRGLYDGEPMSDWLEKLAAFSKRRREIPKAATPAEWVVLVDEVLKAFGWPGESSLDSAEFQLINRWRELLNEFARLGLVSKSMAATAAISRLDLLAREVVFQPESQNAAIHLMGPLEASGVQFDAIWVTGLSSTNWPPPGSPSALISRRLQEKHDMPDCTPGNSLHYARTVMLGLLTSGATVRCSYALNEDDTEQTVSDLLAAFQPVVDSSASDPGRYAVRLRETDSVIAAVDKVPTVAAGEKIAGGAGTIQRQIRDPVAAFVQGRMSAKLIYPQAVGIPAPMRGNLIHDALYQLYIDLPSSKAIGSWQGKDLESRIGEAVDFAFSRHEKNSDAVLHQLFRLERRRVADLLRQFVVVDAERGSFQVNSVEAKIEFVAGHIRLPLRFDRIDRFDDESIAILDYKSGSRKKLLNRNGEAEEIQLFVYAAAVDAPVSMLSLVNVDSREIVLDGAGRGFSDIDEWPELLSRIKSEVAVACADLAKGDVRINSEQGIKSARPLNVLTRYTELRRDNG